MPTYEYECKSCGHLFEVFQNMSDAPLKDCPQCGKEIRRLIHGGTGIIFKGSGFYVTDKKGGASSSAAGGTKAGGTKPETPPAGTPASTPADSTKPAPAAPPAPAAEKKAAG